MDIAQISGVALAHDSFGEESGEPVLLIAGLGTQMIRWTEDFCQALAVRGYRVIRFDNRDAGQSTHFAQFAPPNFAELAAQLMAGKRPSVAYTLLDMAVDAIGLLDHLGIERAHIVGRSMGGMIAQIMASEFPERVLSLTSIMSSSGNPSLPQADPEVMGLMMRPAPDPESDIDGFLSHSLAFARRIAGTGHPFDEQAHEALVRDELGRGVVPGGMARQVAAMAVAGDRRSRLAAITAPTLVVHGTDDPLFPPACGRDTADAIPGAELLLLEGMGHDLPPPFHDEVIQAIDRLRV